MKTFATISTVATPITEGTPDRTERDFATAVEQINLAAESKKCWNCGCLKTTLQAIDDQLPADTRPPNLLEAMDSARQRLVSVRYECLGCEVCHPAIACNALQIEDSCPVADSAEGPGWPPLPGDYRTLRFQGPVAVCTLFSCDLMEQIAAEPDPSLSIVGTLQTENLGIERLIQNITANPNIRFLVVCGEDSRQAIGHLPGQTLVSLSRWGMDEHGRIINAAGRHPRLKNLPPKLVEHFRKAVEVVDLVGELNPDLILSVVHHCAERWPGAADPVPSAFSIRPLPGHLPERMISDPAGYFVVYVDRLRGTLSLEHFGNDGVLDGIYEAGTAAELYTPVIEEGLVTRLDHAAYLGRELARAEDALKNDKHYIQDGAPELTPELQVPVRQCACNSEQSQCVD